MVTNNKGDILYNRYFSKKFQLNASVLLTLLLVAVHLENTPFLVSGLTVAVFGGSGYLGRRITQSLVDEGCDVISISRSGKPPQYYLDSIDDVEESSSTSKHWSDLVQWVSYDIDEYTIHQNIEQSSQTRYQMPQIDAAISCIGNVNPDPQWVKTSFFGLGFNDARLFHENGILNKNAIQMAKDAGAKDFVYTSVSYEVAKMLEGPIPGYINGKREAEHAAYSLFGEKTFVLGPSLMYGGNRFNAFGNFYSTFVESNFAKSYTGFNNFLRNLSSAPMEDWVEKVIFTPPVKVDVVARVACAAALGYITRDMIGDRQQGFFDTKGKSVMYDNVIFVDGTKELLRVDAIVESKLKEKQSMNMNMNETKGTDESIAKVGAKFEGDCNNKSGKEPSFEGALIGKTPLLYPLPVVFFFASIFGAIASGSSI